MKTKKRIKIILSIFIPLHIVLQLLLLLYILLFIGAGPIGPGIEEIKLLNYDYSQSNISFSYPIRKDEFHAYAAEIADFHNSGSNDIYGSDSLFSALIRFNDLSIKTEVVIIEDSGSVCVKLKRIENIIYNSDLVRDTSMFEGFTKQYCLRIFKDQFISPLEDTLRSRLKLDTLYAEGLAYINSNDYVRAYSAFDYIDSVLSKTKNRLRRIQYSALNRMAFIRIQQGSFLEALELLERAKLVEPWETSYEEREDYERTRDSLPETAKRYWIRKSHIDEIKSQYRYNAINVEQILIHLNLAKAYIMTEQLEKAKRSLDKAEKLYPDFRGLSDVKRRYDMAMMHRAINN